MPYIAKEHRSELDKIAQRLIEQLPKDDAHLEVFGFLYEMMRDVYCGHTGTRYFLQNEMIGVLSCMSFEWQDRRDVYPNGDRSIAKLPEISSATRNILKDLISLIPKDDYTLRPGHLNYFITILMRDAIKSSIFVNEEIPNWIEALSRHLYSTLTRPYEDSAIAKNGDVF